MRKVELSLPIAPSQSILLKAVAAEMEAKAVVVEEAEATGTTGSLILSEGMAQVDGRAEDYGAGSSSGSPEGTTAEKGGGDGQGNC